MEILYGNMEGLQNLLERKIKFRTMYIGWYILIKIKGKTKM